MKIVVFLSDYEDEVEYQAVFDLLSDSDIRGITAKPGEISVINSSSGTSFSFKGKPLTPDLVIGYAYEDDLLPATKLMTIWRMAGVRVLNGPETLFPGQNKDLSSAMLNAAEGIRHLPYYKFFRRPDAEEMNNIGFPLVAKPVNGACGRGLFKFNNYAEFSNWFMHSPDLISNYYIQPYIPKRNNEDFRIVVVNYVACYAYSRQGANGSWITNLMQDGTGTAFTTDQLSPELIQMAERSAVAAGSLFCGVDIALDEAGSPFIIEINTCPAIKISRYIPGADTLVEQAFADFIRQELIKHEI